MRQRVILVFGVFLLLVIAMFFLTKHTPVQQIPEPFYKDASSLQQPTIIGNQAYYFTGSSFAKLDLASGQTHRLSDYFYSQGAVNVSSWTDHSVLFSTSGTSDSDTFGQVILRAGHANSSNSSYWWRYDFQTRQLQLLDFRGAQDCASFSEVGQSLVCLMPHSGSTHSYDFYGYSLDSHTWQKIRSVSQTVSSPSSVGNDLFYVTTDLSGRQSLWSLDVASANNTLVYSSGRVFSYTADSSRVLLDEAPLPDAGSAGNAAISTGGAKVSQKLLLISTAGKVLKQVGLSGGTGQFMKTSGSLSYTLKDGNIFIAANGKNSIKQYLIDQPNIASAWQNNGNTYFFDTKSNLMSTKKLSSLKGPDSFIEVYNVEPNTFYINVVNGGQNTVYLNDSSKPFVANADGVAVWLNSIGFDPNQFSFGWQLLNVADESAITSNSAILH
jgi:hypothetical protein